jgi:hypothetical protein
VRRGLCIWASIDTTTYAMQRYQIRFGVSVTSVNY